MIFLIIIAGVSIIPFWIRNRKLFMEGFGDPFGARINLMLIESHNMVNDVPGKPMFSVYPNFSNFTANLILKFIGFIIVLIIVHFSHSLIFTSAYIFLLMIAWHVYKKRKAFYNDMSDVPKNAYSTLYKSCVCIPLYQTLLFLLVEIAYIFDI